MGAIFDPKWPSHSPSNSWSKSVHNSHIITQIYSIQIYIHPFLASKMPIIRTFFGKLGDAIGRWPLRFGLFSFLIGILLSAGMLKIHLEDHIRDGYTPENAPSRSEIEAMRQFWNASGDPMKSLVIIRSKLPNKNMFRLDLLSEVVELYNYLLHHFTVYIDDNSSPFTYDDICVPFCEFNFGFELFVDGLDQAMADFVANDGLQKSTKGNNLSFPLATVHSLNIRLEWFFFGVQLQQQKNNSMPINVTLEQQFTNIHSVQMVLLSFHGERSTPTKVVQLNAWEMAVFDYFQNKFHSDFIDVQIVGTEILNSEMSRDHKENTHFFALGILAISIFVGLNVFLGTNGQMHCGKFVIASATVLCPLLAISSAFGAISLLGLRTNSFLLILPYLILGIGVDDGFLLMHRWFQLAQQNVRQPQKRIALVFSEVGPSITVTTLTNVISFGIGAFTPTPEIRLFCFGTALALSLDYFLQLALFCPIMLFSARFEEQIDERNNDGKNVEMKKQKIDNEWNLGEPRGGMRKYSPFKVEEKAKNGEGQFGAIGAKLFKGYCVLLTNKFFGVFILLLLALYWSIAILGVGRIQTKLDIEKILPRDSKMRETSRLLDKYIWTNHLVISVLVNGNLNISSSEEMSQFWGMVQEFEALPKSKGAQSSLVWLRDYEAYFWGKDESEAKMAQFVGELEMGIKMKKKKLGKMTNRNGQMDLCKLVEFLDIPFYSHWNASIRYGEDKGQNGCPTISAFVISFAFGKILGWEDRIELMQSAREIARRHSAADGLDGLKINIWEDNVMFVDQILSLSSVTVQSGLLTFLCMAFVCAFFVPNPISVLLASASICSISIGVFGFLSWLQFDLDPVTMAATLMSIGISVDFTAHVVYHFRQDFRHEFCRDSATDGSIERVIPLRSRADKLKYTLESIGWPMLQSGISTALCILPLLFVRKYAPTVFANAVFLVCGLGLLHGLLVLPCLLCLLPSWCSSRIEYVWIDSFCGIFSAKGVFRVQDAGEKTAIKERDENGKAEQKQKTMLKMSKLMDELEEEEGDEHLI